MHTTRVCWPNYRASSRRIVNTLHTRRAVTHSNRENSKRFPVSFAAERVGTVLVWGFARDRESLKLRSISDGLGLRRLRNGGLFQFSARNSTRAARRAKSINSIIDRLHDRFSTLWIFLNFVVEGTGALALNFFCFKLISLLFFCGVSPFGQWVIDSVCILLYCVKGRYIR